MGNEISIDERINVCLSNDIQTRDVISVPLNISSSDISVKGIPAGKNGRSPDNGVSIARCAPKVNSKGVIILHKKG